MGSSKTSLKLLVDKKGERVLFAAASKEFVDFLFHIFSLPIGTLIEFLGTKQMVGCLGKLEESIDSFNPTYLQPGVKKDYIFNPKTSYNGNPFLLSNDADLSTASKEIYKCCNSISNCYIGHPNCHKYTALYPDAKCPGCGCCMQSRTITVFGMEETAVKDNGVAVTGGYVKEVDSYMVLDDLVVKSMSSISSTTLIDSFGVKDLSQLEEKLVSFGKDEALKLLKASLVTDKVLTTLFLHNIT